MKTIFLSTLISFSFVTTIFCQNGVIHLKNPSFEDYPRAERVPVGWNDCGFPGESPSDTHPSGAFEVVKYPSDGNTYLGMVARDNDTWERVSQILSSPLIGGQCYAFKIDLCRAERYISISRETGEKVNYVEPISLVIWGGNSICEKNERLLTTRLIENTEWETYDLRLHPSKNFEYLLLEAFYKEPVLLPYNGNVLVDNASALIPIVCDSVMEWSEPLEPQSFYYNSSLSSTDKALIIEEILAQIENLPEEQVNIIIEEKSRKMKNAQKAQLVAELVELGVPKDKFKIYTYDK